MTTLASSGSATPWSGTGEGAFRHVADRVMLFGLGGLSVFGVVFYVAWIASDDLRYITFFFSFLGTPFLVLCAVVEMVFSWKAVHCFRHGEPLHGAWRLILAGGICHTIGITTQHLLSANSALNPLAYSSLWSEALAQDLEEAGHLISGPLRLAVLVAGLAFVLAATKRLIPTRLSRLEYLLVGCVGLFSVSQVAGFCTWLMKPSEPLTLARLTTGINDPLLSILLLQAILLRRKMMALGSGRIALCWKAVAAGIFLTSLGSVGNWAEAYGYLPYPYSSVTWYVWFPAATAYALGPIYQVQAARAAMVWSAAPDPFPPNVDPAG